MLIADDLVVNPKDAPTVPARTERGARLPPSSRAGKEPMMDDDNYWKPRPAGVDATEVQRAFVAKVNRFRHEGKCVLCGRREDGCPRCDVELAQSAESDGGGS